MSKQITSQGTKTMKKVTRYQCQFCQKDFKTPDRHQCKKDPELKNCFTCKHLRGWLESEHYEVIDVGFGGQKIQYPPYPDCAAGEEGPEEGGWDIEQLKSVGYNMSCSKWEEGRYDFTKEWPGNEPEGLW